MKKLLALVLSFVMMCSVFVPVGASELDSNVVKEVLSAETPAHIIDLAKAEIQDLLYSQVEGDMDLMKLSGEKYIDLFAQHYSLGSPINIKEYGSVNRIYHFPVMRNGEIFAIFTIYDNQGEYSLQIEESFLAEQLQSLKEKGLLKNVSFISNENGFYVQTEDEIVPLLPDCIPFDSKGNTNSAASIEQSDDLLKKVPMDITKSIMDVVPGNSKLAEQKASSKYLSVTSVAQTTDDSFKIVLRITRMLVSLWRVSGYTFASLRECYG